MLFCGRNKQWVSLYMNNLQGWAGDPRILEHSELSVACYRQLLRYCSPVFRANLKLLDEAWSDQSIISLYVIQNSSDGSSGHDVGEDPSGDAHWFWSEREERRYRLLWLEPQSISSTNEGPIHSCDRSVMRSYTSNKTYYDIGWKWKVIWGLWIVPALCCLPALGKTHASQVKGSATLRGLAQQPGYFQRVKRKSLLVGMPFTCHLDSGLLS